MMRSHRPEVPRELYYYGKKGETVYGWLRRPPLPVLRLFSVALYIPLHGSHKPAVYFMCALRWILPPIRMSKYRQRVYKPGRSLCAAPCTMPNTQSEVVKKVLADDGWEPNG